MPDPQDTNLDPALNDPNPQDNPSADPPDDSKPTKPFSPEQEQFIGSWMGRLIKKQIDESLIPEIKQHMGNFIPQHKPDSGGEDYVKKFNEEITTEFFENPMAAFQKLMNVHQNAQSNLSKGKQTQLTKSLTNYVEKPLYKEIYSDMKQIAEDVMKDGFPPEAAAEHAYFKAKANYLEKEKFGSGDDGSFGSMSGGIHQKKSKSPQLPPQFKEAAARDIAEGLYKSEEEYIKALHPSIRKTYGL